MCACAISSVPSSRLTRRSPNTFPKTVRNELPPVFGMCRNSTGFARDSLLSSTRFRESLVAKEQKFIAAYLLFYSRNSMTTRACCQSTFAQFSCSERHRQALLCHAERKRISASKHGELKWIKPGLDYEPRDDRACQLKKSNVCCALFKSTTAVSGHFALRRDSYMSGNRWLQMTLARSNSLTALAAGLLSVLLTFLVMHLWRFDLNIPAVYWGDGLYVNVLAKALTEGAWNYHIARLGAPFGLDAVDFPYGCTLDLAIIKILTVITRNPFLSVNLYWLLTIAMAGAFAALFFRSLQIRHL